MSRTLGLLVLAVPIALLAPTADPPQATVGIDAIADAVRTQEHLLLNLQVAGHRDWEIWNQDTAEWVYGGEADFRAWLTGEPASKVRIDYARQITTWVDGPAPFGENSYRLAFDGQVSKRLQTRIGVAGAPSDVLVGELTPGPPQALGGNGGFESGWRFLAPGASPNEAEGIRFSDYLLAARTYAPRLDIFETEVDRARCVAVRVGEPGGQQRAFYFDASKGYALVGGEFRFANGAVGERWTAHELRLLVDGVYFPTFVTRELFRSDGRPRERSTLHASEITANDPAWTDEIFDPPWPAGTVVNDKIAGAVYQIAPGTEQMEAAVDEQIGELLDKTRPPASARDEPKGASRGAPEDVRVLTPQPQPAPTSAEGNARPQATSRPTSRPTDLLVYSPRKAQPEGTRDVRVVAPQAPKDFAPARSHSSEVLVVLLGAGALAVIGVLVLRGKRPGPLVILLCVGLSRSSALDQRLLALSLPQLGQQKLTNCGLNAAIFVCRHFGTPSAVDELAEDLCIGEHHERAASLLALKRAFLHRGLSVEGYRDARIEEIASALDGASLWLLHVNRMPESPGHFYVVGGRDGEQICWIDPSVWRRWLSPAELAAELEGKFDGWCLRIGPPEERPRASLPAGEARLVAWFPQRVNLGMILPEHASRTPITVTFVADAHAPVQLSGCTDGLQLARECVDREAGVAGEFSETRTYSFRLRERGVGPVEETLTFRSTGRGAQPIVVPVHGLVRVAPAEGGDIP
jgi:hypothetical protein